ncbi:MAG: anthranilate phosphoribosyltransferase [bacterium]
METDELFEQLIDEEHLSFERARGTMDKIMEGEWDDAQIGAFLSLLRSKGETSEEIAGFARSMREHASTLTVGDSYRPLVDTCGTGGDTSDTINISTMSAIVASGMGVNVAKHGNRSVSSSCGSADLLEALGVELELSPEQVKESIEEVGMGFMYAPAFHKAMKHAIGPRKSLGIRTVINLLGPLTNPANADRQLLGVFSERWVRPVAEALSELGVERALVVHGTDGLDEISMSATTVYAEVTNGEVQEGEITPKDFGESPIEMSDIASQGVEGNRDVARSLVEGEARPPVEKIIFANAGAVIYVAGEAESLAHGFERARESVESGKAQESLDQLVDFTSRI